MKIEYSVILKKDLYTNETKQILIEINTDFPLTYSEAKSRVYNKLETLCNTSEELQDFTCVSDFWETQIIKE